MVQDMTIITMILLMEVGCNHSQIISVVVISIMKGQVLLLTILKLANNVGDIKLKVIQMNLMKKILLPGMI